ncbi:hypothetical protein [Neobacillus sp. D3-1R]|uniref:hypothetical protein n=1 Tax=Neobacillus sp. D3-1R TaxID=3445778 RepID=UPI003F9EEC72
MDQKIMDKLLKILSYTIKIGGVLLILIGISAFVWTLYIHFYHIQPIKFWEGIYKNIGTLAEIVGIGAGLIWVLRKIWMTVKKQNLSFVEPFKQLYLFFREYHIYLGIILIITAFAHGLYFFLNPEEDVWNNYTGIAAFLSLIPLSLLGWYHYENKTTKKNKKSKRNHTTFAIIFTVLFLIHWSL